MTFAPPVGARERTRLLDATRHRKMARSSHAYVRGNTAQFYELLSAHPSSIPEGPPVWICGDCHVGNLGPVADGSGRIRVQIRDLDQTVIGNPAHDIIRLALSLASAARSSDLPGVTTARILGWVMEGYESAFLRGQDPEDAPEAPDAVKVVMRQAARRTWKALAAERIDDTRPTIPLGKRFWATSATERRDIERLFTHPGIASLVTTARSRADDARIEVIDAAYWVKGCSSLGLARHAVLLEITDRKGPDELCLIDIKQAITSSAPPAAGADIPSDPGARVVEGARQLSPFLGDRMRAAHLGKRSMFLRELLPQDLKIELEQLSNRQAKRSATYLASVVGRAHARQMDQATRRAWRAELQRRRPADLDAPSWLWTTVISLLIDHERSYLEHCRRHALLSQR